LKVFFKDKVKDTTLYTKLKVSSTIASWFKEYEAVVDTGAFNTAIPTDEIIPPNITPPKPNLKYMGICKVKGVGLNGHLDVYEATLSVGEEDEFQNVQVVGVPHNLILLGREIISRYKWEIDWKTRSVKATINP
jgi:hypothetical protein